MDVEGEQITKRGMEMKNPAVRQVYEDLGRLLEAGDDVFIEQGPDLLKQACADPAFLAGVAFVEADGRYTRTKVIGDPGRHVIRGMVWPGEFYLIPHEHHGRPCFEVVLDGLLKIYYYRAIPKEGEVYELEAMMELLVGTGEHAVIDPRITEVHAVRSMRKSRAIHVYPQDKDVGYGFIRNGQGLYARRSFPLPDDTAA